MNLPPVQLPGVDAPAEKPGIVAKAAQTAWDWKHAATTIALALTVFGPLIVQYWPQAAPVIDVAKKIAESEAAAPAKPTDPYERDIKAAWQIEEGAAEFYRKRLIYLYRGTIGTLKTAKTAGDVTAAFAAQEKSLDMSGRLPIVRGVIVAQWHAEIPPPPPTDAVTDASRQRMTEFLTRTISILERLP